MENKRIQESELRVMKILWKEGDTKANRIAELLNEQVGWHINTTYTVINKCIAKGYIQRIDPKFVCHALIGEADVAADETKKLIDDFYGGSVDKLYAALVGKSRLTDEQIEKLIKIVGDLQ